MTTKPETIERHPLPWRAHEDIFDRTKWGIEDAEGDPVVYPYLPRRAAEDLVETVNRQFSAALSVPAAAVVGEPVAWMHPTANWSDVDRQNVLNHCVKDGDLPVPLYAAPSAPDGWQSIESAPKDGTKILLCLTGYQPVVGYFDGHRWDYQDREDFIEEDHWFAWQEQTGDWYPDHWMPIPAPPAIRSETP